MWQEKRGTWGQHRKCKRIHEKPLNKNLNKKHEKHYFFQSWWMVHNTTARYAPIGRSKNMSFARLSALWNLRRNKANFGKILKGNFLKLISATTIFLVIIMLKLTKFHEIKGNNSFRLQNVLTNTWYSAENHSYVSIKALQIRWLEKMHTLWLFSIWICWKKVPSLTHYKDSRL